MSTVQSQIEQSILDTIARNGPQTMTDLRVHVSGVRSDLLKALEVLKARGTIFPDPSAVPNQWRLKPGPHAVVGGSVGVIACSPVTEWQMHSLHDICEGLSPSEIYAERGTFPQIIKTKRRGGTHWLHPESVGVFSDESLVVKTCMTVVFMYDEERSLNRKSAFLCRKLEHNLLAILPDGTVNCMWFTGPSPLHIGLKVNMGSHLDQVITGEEKPSQT